MLRSHPALSLPTGESHFFVPLYERRDQFGDLRERSRMRRLVQTIYDSRREFFDTDLHGVRFDVDEMAERLHAQGRATVAEVIAGIFETNAQGEGKRRWGDKTPYYALHLETLLGMFPDAQVVHVLRDGRDCCLSMLERRRDLRIYDTYHAAYVWSRYVEHAQSFGMRHPEIYLELRYEALLADPIGSVRALCDFLGEPFDVRVVNFQRAGEAGKTPLLSGPLQVNNSEKWRSHMSPRALRIFESKAGETLARNGYELITRDHPLGGLAVRWQELKLGLQFRLHRLYFR
jgi:hypothetical protein